MKRTISTALIVIMAISTVLNASAQEGFSVSVPSAILMSDGQVLYELNAHQPMEPASVTKVMTILLVLEALESNKIALTDTITASAHAASMGGSQIWLEEGEVMTVQDMLKAVVLASANDCSVALAEYISGSEQAFVLQMNERALSLGMQNTTFKNACGLDEEGHLSTAYDIALMSEAVMKHEMILDYTLSWMDTIRDGQFELTNTNKLVNSYSGITGLKTGSTSLAGFCLSATAQRDNLALTAVVLGADTSANRNTAVASLLDYGFANYAVTELSADRPIMPIPVTLGSKPEVLCQLERSQPVLIKKEDLSGIEKIIEMETQLSAPIDAGQRVGTLTVKNGDKVISEIPIITSEAVQRLSMWDILLDILSSIALR